MINLKKNLNSDSPTHHGDSPSFLFKIQKLTLRLSGESLTPRLGELRIRRVGELFFDYEYLCEFEAKIGTAQKEMYGIYSMRN
jgi:hypothetical protein